MCSHRVLRRQRILSFRRIALACRLLAVKAAAVLVVGH
jgi:hypothetical protein